MVVDQTRGGQLPQELGVDTLGLEIFQSVRAFLVIFVGVKGSLSLFNGGQELYCLSLRRRRGGRSSARRSTAACFEAVTLALNISQLVRAFQVFFPRAEGS